MGGSTDKEIQDQNLYIELILAMIAVAFGSLVLAASRRNARSTLSNVRIENLSVAAYVVNGTNDVVVVNWGDEPENVELVCLLDDGNVAISNVEVEANSTVSVNAACQGKLVATAGGNPIPTFIVSSDGGR